MRNPWRARNPWLSLWLHGANTLVGAARAEARRNAHRRVNDSVTRALHAWSAAMVASKAPRSRGRDTS
jgi:hypothetical protein